MLLPNCILRTYIFLYNISKMTDLIQIKGLPVNTARPVFPGQLVARYHDLSCPLTTARFEVVAPTW